jgi:hypothetical protein
MMLPHTLSRRVQFDAVEIMMVAFGVVCVVGAIFLF